MYNSHKDGPHVEAAPVLVWVFFGFAFIGPELHGLHMTRSHTSSVFGCFAAD